MKYIPSSGKDLMRICLMSNIPNQNILRCIENVVQGNGKFNYSQTRSQMTHFNGDYINDKASFK